MLNRNNTKSGKSLHFIKGSKKHYYYEVYEFLGFRKNTEFYIYDVNFISIINNTALINRNFSNCVYVRINRAVHNSLSPSRMSENATILREMLKRDVK